MSPEEGRRLDAEEAKRKAAGIEILNKSLEKHGWRYVRTGLAASGTVIVYTVARIDNPARIYEWRIRLDELLHNPIAKVMDEAFERVVGKKPPISLFIVMQLTNYVKGVT